MKILSIDQHISVNADVQHALNELGHSVTIASLSGHSAVIRRPQAKIPLLEGDGWCSIFSEKRVEQFYEQYKEPFSEFDAFLCCYPPIFSMLYERWQKPIIVYMPIRYECGAECNAEMWLEFNEYLRRGVDSGQIILLSNSMYDKKYAEGFLEREVEHIPSYCDYTGMSFNPIYPQFLYYAAFKLRDPGPKLILKHDALKAGHAWQDVADFRGCIHFPYNASLMSIFEQYVSNIPLFFPTKRYLLEMWLNEVPVVHQICWPATLGKTPGSIIPHKHEKDPNNYSDFNIISHWLDYADYYYGEMKHIQYFDNREERNAILELSDKALFDISSKMREDNVRRKISILNKWNDVMKRIA